MFTFTSSKELNDKIHLWLVNRELSQIKLEQSIATLSEKDKNKLAIMATLFQLIITDYMNEANPATLELLFEIINN